MLDVRLIRENADHVRERLALRYSGDETKIDEVLELDQKRRQTEALVQKLSADRNRISKEIGALMAQKKVEEAEKLKEQVRDIKLQIDLVDTSPDEWVRRLKKILLPIPNLPHSSVPRGKTSEENPEIRRWGNKPEFAFTPKSHVELCEQLKLIDFQRGTKLSGSGFLLYTGCGAKLERALINMLLELHTTEHGYTEVSPPFIVKTECMEGVGQFPKFKDQAYAVAEGANVISLWESRKKIQTAAKSLVEFLGEKKRDVYANFGNVEALAKKLFESVDLLNMDIEDMERLALVPTAEAPVANIHREEILAEKQLPIRYVAYSPCFRAEAGAAGLGTRGMIRVHQFDKVELIKIVKPEDSYDELEKMVANAEKVLQLLGLHYRVINLCTGDMGFASAKTYDIEVWAPGQGTYLEVSSCSNCEDFQSRRMNMRFKTEAGENKLPHILNGSGTALARLFVALIETHQQEDGSVVIPAALQPYLKADKISA